MPFSHEICNAKAVGHYSCIGEMQISEFLPCSGFVVTSFLFVSARNFPFNCVSEQRFVSLLVFFRCLFAFFFFPSMEYFPCFEYIVKVGLKKWFIRKSA